MVTICDNADQCLTQTSIEVPSIIEKGCRDEFVELKGGGRIHLIMSFVLTDQERRKIESMRLRVLKRREEERVKRTIVFQNVQPSGKELKAATMPAVTITEVDDDPTHGNKDSRESASGPIGFGSITKPTLMFDYARAVGLQSRQACQRAEKRSKIWAADVVSKEVKAGIYSFKYDEQILRQSAEKELGFGSHENAMINSSAMSSRSLQRAASSLTSSIDIASTLIVSPSGQDSSPGKVTLGDVKIQAEVVYTSLSKGRDEPGIPASDIEEDKWGIEDKRSCCVLEAEAPIMANSFNDRSTLVGERMKNSGFRRGATHFASEGQTLIWSRHQAVQARSSLKDIPKFEGPSGQGQRVEARPGPGARWAQKTGLETRWTSSEKARQIARCAWNGPISDPFKARAKILKLIKSASASHDVCGDDQRLEERHGLTDSIGVVLNKVVGGAAIFLVALLMIWPIPEGSRHGSDESNEDNS